MLSRNCSTSFWNLKTKVAAADPKKAQQLKQLKEQYKARVEQLHAAKAQKKVAATQ